MIHVVDFEKNPFSTPFRGILPPCGPQFDAESLFQKPYAVVRLRGRLYRNRSRYFAPVSRRSIN